MLLYDIMTERFEITTMLQRALSQQRELFGTLEQGTPDNPSDHQDQRAQLLEGGRRRAAQAAAVVLRSRSSRAPASST